jgi:hypothetical protein
MINEAQFQQLLATLEKLKPSAGIHWEAVVPVFLSALLAMCVGIVLEHYRGLRERRKANEKRAKDELSAINIATVAMATNLELLVHFAFQIIIPHFEDSHGAYQAGQNVPILNDEIGAFVRSVQGRFPHIMMTAPELNILEHDFLVHLPFAVAEAPELLQRGAWFVHLSRVLRKHLQDRNRQVELAARDALKGMQFNEVMSALQIQDSIGIAECVATLQSLEQTQIIARTLERIGRGYMKVGKAKKLIPPVALGEAIERLRAIAAPFVSAMAGEPPADLSDPGESDGETEHKTLRRHCPKLWGWAKKA